ncbi:hypothetical protein [Borreliella valaisiana]|nr:hypothetical protein [Borreliella valaisiana]
MAKFLTFSSPLPTLFRVLPILFISLALEFTESTESARDLKFLIVF